MSCAIALFFPPLIIFNSGDGCNIANSALKVDGETFFQSSEESTSESDESNEVRPHSNLNAPDSDLMLDNECSMKLPW